MRLIPRAKQEFPKTAIGILPNSEGCSICLTPIPLGALDKLSELSEIIIYFEKMIVIK